MRAHKRSRPLHLYFEELGIVDRRPLTTEADKIKARLSIARAHLDDMDPDHRLYNDQVTRIHEMEKKLNLKSRQ